jgi:hypothetical protein
VPLPTRPGQPCRSPLDQTHRGTGPAWSAPPLHARPEPCRSRPTRFSSARHLQRNPDPPRQSPPGQTRQRSRSSSTGPTASSSTGTRPCRSHPAHRSNPAPRSHLPAPSDASRDHRRQGHAGEGAAEAACPQPLEQCFVEGASGAAAPVQPGSPVPVTGVRALDQRRPAPWRAEAPSGGSERTNHPDPSRERSRTRRSRRAHQPPTPARRSEPQPRRPPAPDPAERAATAAALTTSGGAHGHLPRAAPRAADVAPPTAIPTLIGAGPARAGTVRRQRARRPSPASRRGHHLSRHPGFELAPHGEHFGNPFAGHPGNRRKAAGAVRGSTTGRPERTSTIDRQETSSPSRCGT